MALNKYMHPRNIYKKPPDFSKLVKEFHDFSDIAKVDVTGKVSIDFKDPQALRILTKCLLKSDFHLDVIIPNDRLVPTLPLRLNYILWIEDLMAAIDRNDSIHGLDIGTGACAIYPLLAAVKNKWYMLGTETDEQSFQKAEDNIKRNDLQDFIKLKRNKTSLVIEYLFLEQELYTFDFCMCNPPFYTNIQELWESRSPARPPPKNAFTGSPQELVTEGGELQFCRQIIQESKRYKDNILIYTTMIGHKYNLKELVIELKAEGIKHVTTEFCQGRVTRWGLAWTYQDYDFSQIIAPREKYHKKSLPIILSLPELSGTSNNADESIDKLKNILKDLQILYNFVTKRKNETILNIRAYSNTWSNQRRKRRLHKQIQEEAKQQKLELNSNAECCPVPEICLMVSNNPLTPILTEEKNIQGDVKNVCDQHGNTQKKTEILIQALIKLFTKDKELKLEFEYLSGKGGKDGVHQIVQYIKNNWK